MKKLFTCLIMLLTFFSAGQARVLWTGEQTYFNGRAQPKADHRITLKAEDFAGIVAGDRLVFYFTNYADDPITSQHIIRLSTPLTYAPMGHNINVSEGDRKASVFIDDVLKEKLTTVGLVIGGTGFTLSSISVEPASEILWEGLKVINNTGWTVGVLESYLFANVKEGDVLFLSVEQTSEGAECVLKERSTWKNLHSAVPNGNSFRDFKSDGVSLFSFSLDADAVTSLKTHGMLVAGSKYNLLSVALGSPTPSRIQQRESNTLEQKPVYNLNGVKVADKWRTDLPRGIYVVNGRKFLTR